MDILIERAGGVLTIALNRPDKKNAITAAMYQEMADAFFEAEKDAAVRAVLIRGNGGSFSAGNDLEDFLKTPPVGDDAPVFRFLRAISSAEKPIVAAVAGAAVGIGTTMLLHCDLVYTADDARFALPFANLGLVPEFASSLLLPLVAGRVKAAEKILLGDPFTAEEAQEMRLVNAILPPGEVLNHARRVAERFSSLAPSAVRESKKLLRRGQQKLVQETMAVESELFGERLRGPEAQEAFQAFFEKRKPDFSKFS